eukprot:9325452-Prorocentrum_lima.AAC.1
MRALYQVWIASAHGWVGPAGNSEALGCRKRADRHPVLGQCVLGDRAWTPRGAKSTRLRVRH